MEMVVSSCGNVFNFISEIGLQVSVKVNDSGWYTDKRLDRDNPITAPKNKVSVVISSSVGCPLKCTFCHLTQQSKPYIAVDSLTVAGTVVAALRKVAEVAHDCDFSSRYLKLCFMGEGEPILNLTRTKSITHDVLTEVIGWFAGLDGVDLSTTFPIIPPHLADTLGSWNIDLDREFNDQLNPANYPVGSERTVVRLFYSLHHWKQECREAIIPNVKPITEAMAALDLVSKQINVIVHYMFMQGVNDSIEDVEGGLMLWADRTPVMQDVEFRVLRYNPYDSSQQESRRIRTIVHELNQRMNVKRVKVQYSAGEDVAAACGMFLEV